MPFFKSRWPSSAGGGLQNRRGWCDSSTGFQFFGHHFNRWQMKYFR
jgi:hypothetical protein